MARKFWRIETAAGMLAEPVKRTQQRVDDGELPLVVRNGERFVPSAAVLELRERLLRGAPPAPLKEPKTESATAQQKPPSTGGHLGRESMEFSANTVSEAVDVACSELGVSRDELSYEVRDTGLLHVLGLGSNPAIIVVHADATSSVDSSDGSSDSNAALPSSDEGDAATEEPTTVGPERSGSLHYYSLGQAALILKTSHAAVRALVSRGKLPAEEIGGYLWFPSRNFEDFVVSEYGHGKLTLAGSPYPADKVYGPHPHFPEDPSSAPTPTPPPEAYPRAAKESSAPKRTAEDAAGRRAEPATAAEHRRVVMEAAQRYGTSVDEIRQKLAAKQLTYDPRRRRLVESSDSFKQQAGVAETNRDKKPVGPSAGGSTEEKKRVPEEHLYIPDVALELGEPVMSVLLRIGKRELKTKQINGKVMVQRQSVTTLKEKLGSVTPESPKPAAPKAGRGQVEVREGAPDPEGAEPEQDQEAENRTQVEDAERLRRQTAASERSRSAQDELSELRAELGAERERRLRSERAVQELQRQLEESKTREESARRMLSDAKRELVEAREKAEALEGGRLLGNIRRLLSK